MPEITCGLDHDMTKSKQQTMVVTVEHATSGISIATGFTTRNSVISMQHAESRRGAHCGHEGRVTGLFTDYYHGLSFINDETY